MINKMIKFWINFVIIFGVIIWNNGLLAFNLDTVNFIEHAGVENTMFGFSVALHKEKQTSWVLIGAPKADTANIQPGVRRGGAVYRCYITDDNRCQMVPFDSNGNHQNTDGDQIDTKSDQWFGATVASGGIDGPVVACAPRYVYHTMNPRKVTRNEPVGTCFLAKENFQVYTEYSPCRTMMWGYHRLGSCQAGMSAAITKNGERLFIGAPGSYYWQGKAYSINTDVVYPYKPPRYADFGEGGQTYSHDLNNLGAQKVYSTGESTAAEDDSYLGYSSIVGDFNGDGVQGVAVGMPRGGGLLGKVLLFSYNMTNLQNITGEQIGAYFGYALCVTDVDGDKLDDLIIGAPMHTEPNNEGKYDVGRVYIMFQTKFNKFQELTTRDGVNSRGRFGQSLTSLGDINLDGYGDFAVGAPYDGPHGRGAVYIFHGSSNGPLEKYSQVIFAEDVRGPHDHLTTFGFSVSGGIDLDGNLYPDLVVGAYESNRAITFKSRPVAVMEASTQFALESKLINLEDKNCTLKRDGKRVVCTIINSCLKYNGINLPTSADIEVSWTLDAKKIHNPRMFFLADEKNVRKTTMRLYRGKSECRPEKVFITDNVRDKLTPLEVEMKFNMKSRTDALVRNTRALPEPIMDMNHGTVERDSINIQKNCGPDNVCIPDLKLNIKTVEKYLLGSKDQLDVDVNINNNGEDAFEAGFYMQVPPGLSFRKIERKGDIKDNVITCTAPTPATNNTLKCDIGNPLASGKTAHFKVVLMAAPQTLDMPSSYDFYMEANSTNGELSDSGYDNIVRKTVNLWVETDLSVTGVAFESDLLYNISQFVPIKNATKEEEIGPQIANMYEIRNGGPSTIESAEIFLLVPYETLAGDKLMYLLNQPETSGNIQCAPSEYVNENNLILNEELSRKSFLLSQGALDSSSYSSQQSSYSRNGNKHMSSSSSGSLSSSSSSSSGSSSGSSTRHRQQNESGNKHLTESERRRLIDAEENMESVGDASYVHSLRAGEAAAGGTSGSGHAGHAGQGQYSSSSWSSSSGNNNNGPITYSSSYNRSVVRDQDGRVKVFESSTSNYDDAAISSSYRQQQQQQLQLQQQQQQQQQRAQQQNRHFQEQQRQQQNQQANVRYESSGSGRNNQQQNQHNSESSQTYNTGSRYAGSSSSSSSGRTNNDGSSYVQVDDIPTVENVNQDISELNSRSHQQANNMGGGGGSSSASSTTGRRRMYSQQDGQPIRTDLIGDRGLTGIEKAARGGQGFQASSLDLGVLQRDNVDNEMRHSSKSHISTSGGGGGTMGGSDVPTSSSSYFSRSSSSGGSGGGITGSGSSNTRSGSSDNNSQSSHFSTSSNSNQHYSSGGTQSGSSSSGINNGGHQYFKDYSNTGRVVGGGGATSSGTIQHGSVAGGSSSHHHNQQTADNNWENDEDAEYDDEEYADEEEDDQGTQHHRRRKRQTNFNDLELNELLSCNRTKCAIIRCTAGPLKAEQSAWISIRARLVAHTMFAIAPTIPMNISTMALTRISKLPFLGEPQDKPIKRYEVVMTVTPEPEPKPDVVPLWVVILAACAGVIILLLLIYALYKCGFFKRNRPSDSQERQPLNRNGAYHGDEHL